MFNCLSLLLQMRLIQSAWPAAVQPFASPLQASGVAGDLRGPEAPPAPDAAAGAAPPAAGDGDAEAAGAEEGAPEVAPAAQPEPHWSSDEVQTLILESGFRIKT